MFKSGAQRAEHADELDRLVGEHDHAEVLRAFEAAQAAVAPIYDAADVLRDPQYAALGSIVYLPDDELGSIKMTNLPFRLVETPGEVRSPGHKLGQDNAAVYARLGLGPAELEQPRESGVI